MKPFLAKGGPAILFVLAGLVLATRIAAAPVAWVQMVAGGAEARLVTDGPCPTLRVNGVATPMHERAAQTEAYANRICAAALPLATRRIRLDGQALPVPKARPNRLVILGDSGCRLKNAVIQHCNDPTAWPFARVAALAASHKPDLIIHVGDYYYRETPCPVVEPTCAGSPYGDRWPTWKAELFDPAAPLLAAAPWVFVRGNHEDCKRGGAGWFRMLDAAPAPRICPAESATFVVRLGGVRLFIVDSADTEDLSAPRPQIQAFAARLKGLAADHGARDAWIVTHRPIWDTARLGDILLDGHVNATERAAVRDIDLTRAQLVLSGHVHNFTSLSFGEARPPQMIVGTGGDLLDLDDTPPPATGTPRVDGLQSRAFTMGRFGYFLLDRSGADWVGAFHDLKDRVAAICRLHGRALTCRAPTRPF